VRVRQHVNPLELFFEQFRGVAPVIDPARELEVEIGCADAQFLFERAARNPERQYVGLEIREDFVELVNERAAQTKLPVTAVFCQAQLHLPLVFGSARVRSACSSTFRIRGSSARTRIAGWSIRC
jgi:tRNA (guanine-N7-)-methyltransferase